MRFDAYFDNIPLGAYYEVISLQGYFFAMATPITTTGQLGPLLQRLRKRQGLSQSALGLKIGLSQERISRIETNPEKVPLDQILTLMMALDAELRVALRGEASDQANATDIVTRKEW